MATISTYKIKRDKGDYVSNLYTKYNKANVGCFDGFIMKLKILRSQSVSFYMLSAPINKLLLRFL